MATIGENILRLRKQLGWTQEELSQKMGYKSKSTINKIEMGINNIPQNKIAQFAKVLGTTPAELMGWEENTKKELVLTQAEQELLDMYRHASSDKRELIIGILKLASNTGSGQD